jgi:hypothetical protein
MKPIAGKLVTPGNVAIPNATIRLIATNNTTDGALRGTMFTFTANTTGDYAANVLPGSYKVEFKNEAKSKYITLGNVVINDTISQPLEDIGII